MDTPPNSTAVMKVFDDGALPTGHRLKGPPTAMARDHPEDLGLEKQALNEHGSSTSRPPYELTGRKEGLASSVAHRNAVFMPVRRVRYAQDLTLWLLAWTV